MIFFCASPSHRLEGRYKESAVEVALTLTIRSKPYVVSVYYLVKLAHLRTVRSRF